MINNDLLIFIYIYIYLFIYIYVHTYRFKSLSLYIYIYIHHSYQFCWILCIDTFYVRMRYAHHPNDRHTIPATTPTPDKNNILPTFLAWGYKPTGSGAFEEFNPLLLILEFIKCLFFCPNPCI